MKATVIMANEQYAIDIDARDRRAFERDARDYMTLPNGNLREIASAMPETYVGWLSWHACKREGLTRLGWAEFEAELLDVKSEEMASEDFADPIRPTPTVG